MDGDNASDDCLLFVVRLIAFGLRTVSAVAEVCGCCCFGCCFFLLTDFVDAGGFISCCGETIGCLHFMAILKMGSNLLNIVVVVVLVVEVDGRETIDSILSHANCH